MAVLTIIAAMFIYPPFQVIANNGMTFNMGYEWIFDSPKRGGMVANVNVPMLLIQWVGVLIVGGIAFFLAKGWPEVQRVSVSSTTNEKPIPTQPDPMLGTKLEKLQSAEKLFFIALAIDIAVTVIIFGSDIWAIGAMKDVVSSARTGDLSLASSIDFWGSFSKIAFLTMIGVGLGLVNWIKSCYQFSKESLHATAFKQENWVVAGWIIPIFNLFKPYQVINEMYRAGSLTYNSGDDWKKESGSGLILAWWIFWAVTHLIMWTISKEMLKKTLHNDADFTLPQIIGMYETSAWVSAISIVIAGLWFVVANHLTQRLVERSIRYAPLPKLSFSGSTSKLSHDFKKYLYGAGLTKEALIFRFIVFLVVVGILGAIFTPSDHDYQKRATATQSQNPFADPNFGADSGQAKPVVLVPDGKFKPFNGTLDPAVQQDTGTTLQPTANEKAQIAAQEASVRINKMFEEKNYEGIVQEYRTGNNFLVSDFNRIGVATYAARRYSFALNAFLTAERNYPNSSVVKNNLGDTYDALSDQSNALKKYHEALALDPQNSRASEGIKRITPDKHRSAPHESDPEAELKKEWKRQYLESVERQREKDRLENKKL